MNIWVLDCVLRCAFACVRVHEFVRGMSVCACMALCVRRLICVCVFVRARACVRACTRAFVRACACDRASPSGCIFARTCSTCVCACLASVCARPPIARRRVAVSIARPTTAHRRPRARSCVRCHRPGSRASAAGVTWTSRTAKAQWSARESHTSVIDVAGAIYVIGGLGGGYGHILYEEVWASTDGGARLDSNTPVVPPPPLTGAYSRSNQGLLREYFGGTKG